MTNSRQKQSGFTLVELMVSMVISLLVGLAALSSAQFFMGMQRQSTGVSAVLAHLTTAFSAIKFEAAHAGLGFFNDKGGLACGTFNVSHGAVANTGVPMLPVSIALDEEGVSTLNIYYATAIESASATTLAEGMLASATSAKLESYMPVVSGQSVLFVPRAPGTPCSLKTVTSAPTVIDGQQELPLADTGLHNQYAFTTTYAKGDAVALIGDLQRTSYTLEADEASGLNNLVMARPYEGTSAVLAKNVVAMVMQYGISDATGSGAITGWRFPKNYSLSTEPKDWSIAAITGADLVTQVKAVRVAVLVRSTQKDKKIDGLCTTTSTMPKLLGTALGQTPSSTSEGGEGLATDETVTSALTGDWQCYRYAETSVVVPLRNFTLGTKT